MKILFLYGNEKALLLGQWLISEGHSVTFFSEKVEALDFVNLKFDLLISFTYRYIIPTKIIDSIGGNAVNLHISYLPWNRGADPNIWSWIDNTPKGVSIHFVTEKLDAGDVIVQRITKMDRLESLSSSYEKLMTDVMDLFISIFPLFKFWNEMRKKVCGKGSFHYAHQMLEFRQIIDYEVPVQAFIQQYKEWKNNDANNISC